MQTGALGSPMPPMDKLFQCVVCINVTQCRIQDFPLGGGGADLRLGHFSVETYAKMEELDPIGGRVLAAPLDPPMLRYTQSKYFIYRVIAVCIHRHVITMGLSSKYDVDGHYSRFAAQILANPPQYDVTLLCYIAQLYCMQRFNYI